MAKKEIKYDDAIAQIEAIISKFRTDEMSVDELAEQVKRATELITICRDRLHKAERDVKKIVE